MTSTSPRVLVAPQEFKGTLTAVEAANAIAEGLGRAHAAWSFDLLPMADGGPGTTDALVTALGGELQSARVTGPHGRLVDANWGLLPGHRGVIECAAASGLLRLRPDEVTPEGVRRASSYGTGELIRAALEHGVEELIIGLGGSATNDGGAGLVQALGFRLLDAQGNDLPGGGAVLSKLSQIDASGAHPGLRSIRCIGATDVTNPLCGREGASTVYGPQKGADSEAVQELDAALAHFAEIILRDLGVDVAERPGAGAAGGLGAGLIAFLGAELVSGAKVVAGAADLEGRVRGANLVITGEGRLDSQTAYGKAPQFVAKAAERAGVPVICLAGYLGDGYESSAALFSEIEAMSDGSGPLPSRDEAERQIAEASERAVLRLLDRGVLA